MIVTLRTERIGTLDQIRGFLDGNEPVDFELSNRTSAYAFVCRTLVHFEYHSLSKPDKGLLKRFIEKVTGFSKAQVTHLIQQHGRTGRSSNTSTLCCPSHSTSSSHASKPCCPPSPSLSMPSTLTLHALDQLAATTIDLDAANAVQRARDQLLRSVSQASNSAPGG